MKKKKKIKKNNIKKLIMFSVQVNCKYQQMGLWNHLILLLSNSNKI
jgi:hypothetical protein